MELKLTSTVKQFFNILRNDKGQIVNDSALTEIINLFVFYMLDANVKYEKTDDDYETTIYELKINKQYLNMKIFNDKLTDFISEETIKKLQTNKNIKNNNLRVDDIMPFIPYIQFKNFKELYDIKKRLIGDIEEQKNENKILYKYIILFNHNN